MFKSKTIKKYIGIKKNKYTVIQLIPTKSNRNNTTENIASLINRMFKQTSKLIRIENKKDRKSVV